MHTIQHTLLYFIAMSILKLIFKTLYSFWTFLLTKSINLQQSLIMFFFLSPLRYYNWFIWLPFFIFLYIIWDNSFIPGYITTGEFFIVYSFLFLFFYERCLLTYVEKFNPSPDNSLKLILLGTNSMYFYVFFLLTDHNRLAVLNEYHWSIFGTETPLVGYLHTSFIDEYLNLLGLLQIVWVSNLGYMLCILSVGLVRYGFPTKFILFVLFSYVGIFFFLYVFIYLLILTGYAYLYWNSFS